MNKPMRKGGLEPMRKGGLDPIGKPKDKPKDKAPDFDWHQPEKPQTSLEPLSTDFEKKNIASIDSKLKQFHHEKSPPSSRKDDQYSDAFEDDIVEDLPTGFD